LYANFKSSNFEILILDRVVLSSGPAGWKERDNPKSDERVPFLAAMELVTDVRDPVEVEVKLQKSDLHGKESTLVCAQLNPSMTWHL
jgi:hypothetical protein